MSIQPGFSLEKRTCTWEHGHGRYLYARKRPSEGYMGLRERIYFTLFVYYANIKVFHVIYFLLFKNNNNNNNNIFRFHVQSTMVFLRNYAMKKRKCILEKYKNISKNIQNISYVQDEVKEIEVCTNREDNQKLNNLYFYLFHFCKTRKLKLVPQTIHES